MSLREKTRVLFKKADSTSFKSIADYFNLVLSLSGFNVLSDEFLSTKRDRFRIIFVLILPLLGIVGSFRVLWRFFDDFEEVITSILTCIMMLQFVPKMIELFTHRKIHREMIKTVVTATAELQEHREYKVLGLKTYDSARSYICLSTFVFLGALASLQVYPIYPLLLKGEFKLAANIELPWTDHKHLTGWLINYVFCAILATVTCFLILGNEIIFS